VLSRIPKRFGIRALLVTVAIVAAMLLIVQHHFRLKEARKSCDYAWAAWQSVRITDEDMVLASEKLLAAERASPWISGDAAERQHVARLDFMLTRIEAPGSEYSPDTRQRKRRFLLEQIAKHSASKLD
jgi:hypothetical protein